MKIGSVITAPAQAIIDQFEVAQKRISQDPKLLPPWLPILQHYGPSLYQQALNAIELSKDLVKEWLVRYMFKDLPDRRRKATAVAKYLSNHNNFKSHAKRVGLQEFREIKVLKAVKIFDMNKDKELKSRVWGLYHAISITFGMASAYKIFENTEGRALIRLVRIPKGPETMGLV